MKEPELRRELAREKVAVDGELKRILKGYRGVPARLKAAMAHSLHGGGKRLRPVLLLWTHDALAGPTAERTAALRAACAVEMIHTYSLIHDDLPAMDDDVLRRGRPTCHVAFDEATAILAGDALQALGFELLAGAGGESAAELVGAVAAAVGAAGMVGGQQWDLDAEGRRPTPAMVRRIQLGKTARLLAVSLAAGALLAGAGRQRRCEIEAAGRDLGLAFQTIDDVLDVTATTEQLGKSAGKDLDAGKATWVTVEGLEKARRRAGRYGRRAVRGLNATLPAGTGRDRLLDLARLMGERDR